MEKNPIVSVPDNRDLCSFFVTKHSWKGKYVHWLTSILILWTNCFLLLKIQANIFNRHIMYNYVSSGHDGGHQPLALQ